MGLVIVGKKGAGGGEVVKEISLLSVSSEIINMKIKIIGICKMLTFREGFIISVYFGGTVAQYSPQSL